MGSSVDHLIAGIGVRNDREDDNRVKLSIAYYALPNGLSCVPSACKIVPSSIFSEDGGISWHKAEKLTSPMFQDWLVPTSAGSMVANYNSVVFVDGEPHGAFAIADPPNRKTGEIDEAIFAGKLPD